MDAHLSTSKMHGGGEKKCTATATFLGERERKGDPKTIC